MHDVWDSYEARERKSIYEKFSLVFYFLSENNVTNLNVGAFLFNQEAALNYQEMTKHTSAVFQFELSGWIVLLQQIHPVEAFIITCATISAAAAVRPRASAGLRGYTH